jgi:hypothetical protein
MDRQSSQSVVRPRRFCLVQLDEEVVKKCAEIARWHNHFLIDERWYVVPPDDEVVGAALDAVWRGFYSEAYLHHDDRNRFLFLVQRATEAAVAYRSQHTVRRERMNHNFYRGEVSYEHICG